jgi:hypothetical protein
MMEFREFRKKIKVSWIIKLYASVPALVLLGFLFELLETDYTFLPFALIAMFPIFLASLVLAILYIPQASNLEDRDTRIALIIKSTVSTMVSFLLASLLLLLSSWLSGPD